MRKKGESDFTGMRVGESRRENKKYDCFCKDDK